MKKKILSFIIPFILLIIVLFFKGVLFENKSLLFSDSLAQYYRLLSYFKSSLENFSFSYSFSKGLGGSMITTIAYYLASPLNLLLYIFDDVYVFFIFIILIKISLCGSTMYLFLNYHFKNKYLLIFSTAYALSLYNIAGYFQIMWLDGIFLSPLILLGIDKLINEDKALLYGICLFLAILSNYYIGYMICIFSCIYFIYKILLKGFNKKIVYKFLIISFLSGMMTMFLNLPNILITMDSTRQTVDYVGILNTNVLDIISNMYIGSVNQNNFINQSSSFIYCGIFVIPLVLLYFMNININKKEKVLSGSIILLFIFSILIGPINKAWHLFSSPNCFNARYTFLFVIFFIYLACKSLDCIKYITKKQYMLIVLLFLILSIFTIFTELPLYLLYISVFLYLIYIFLFYNFDKKDFQLLFILLSIAEIYFNMHVIFINLNLVDNEYLNNKINEKKEVLEFLQGYDNSYYRIELEDNSFINDSYILNYSDASTWVSTLGTSNDFFEKIGYKVATNMYSFKNYPLINSIFNIKYFESTNMYDYSKVYQHKILTVPNLSIGLADSYLYYNDYVLSLGFSIYDDYILTDNVFENQNNIIKNMTNIDKDIYIKQSLLNENNNYILKVNTTDDYYIDIKINNPSKCDYDVKVNDNVYNIDGLSNTVYLKNDYDINDILKISVSSLCDIQLNNIYVYSLELDNFKTHIDYLKESQLNIIDIKDGYLKGNINSNNKLFLSIPYEKGWNIYVDGKKVDYYKLYNTFIGIDLSNGSHEIEMYYKIPGFKIGLLISFISFICFIFVNKKSIIH